MKITFICLIAVAISFVFVCFAGCTGRGYESSDTAELSDTAVQPTESSDTAVQPTNSLFPLGPSTFTLEPSPSSLPPPEGVEPEVWQLLTSELERQLIELRGASRLGDSLVLRTVSTPPTNEASRTVLSTTSSQLRWGYYSNGNYDQNSEVNVADITPIALHFLESDLPFGFPPDSIQAVIDGDGNGEINVADITPIVMNFYHTVINYKLYRSQDSADYPATPGDGNGSATLLASLELADATGEPNETRLQFAFALPEAMDADYFWVRPADHEATEGIASNLSGPFTNIYTLDGHIYLAGGGTDPLPGVPVDLSGDTTASTVTDENGHYSFDDLPSGNYTVTPTGDPYGYSPVSIDATVTNADKYLSPIYPAPVNIIRRWGLDNYSAAFGGLVGVLKVDAEDNVYFTGVVASSVDNRFYLLKYDMFGELLWSQVYDLQYGVYEVKIFFLPSGEMYLGGGYDLTGIEDSNARDLYVMKLDSSGNLIWDYGYNYPTSGLIDHSDSGLTGYVDSEANLHLQADSQSYSPEVEERHEYMLTISQDGLLLEQARIIPSPGHERVRFHDLELDPMGGILASGLFHGEISTRQALLVRMFPDGTIDWINHWGDFQVYGHVIRVGLDGNIYQYFRGHPPGNNEDRGFQLARYGPDGVRDWEILCTADNQFSDPYFALGPQGKLWLAGIEDFPEAPRETKYPYIWSFQPGDGSLRFAHQWESDGIGMDEKNVSEVQGIEVNSYGVAILSGVSQSDNGEWVDHAVTIQETNWVITHDDSFSFEADDPPAELRESPVSEIPIVGIVDPELSRKSRTFIMLYRP